MVHHDQDPYAVLGLTPTATQAEITDAFRTQMRFVCPDTPSTTVDDAHLRSIVAAYVHLRRLGKQTEPLVDRVD